MVLNLGLEIFSSLKPLREREEVCGLIVRAKKIEKTKMVGTSKSARLQCQPGRVQINVKKEVRTIIQ